MQRREQAWVVGGYVLLAVTVLTAPATVWSREVTRSQQQQLEQRVVPAYQAGQAVVLFEQAGRLAARLPQDQLEAIDAWLTGQQLPALGPMLLEAADAHVQQGGRVSDLKAAQEVIALVRRTHAQQLVELQAERKQLPDSWEGSQPAEDFSAFETRARLLQRLQDRLAAASQTTRLVAALPAGRAAQAAEALHSVHEEQRAIDALSQTVLEHRLRLLLQRLAHSVSVLQHSQDVKQRLLAAHSVDVDGSLLQQTFPASGAAGGQARFQNSRLNDPELPARIKAQVEQGTMLAGELLPKSRQLFAGIFWWLRGRYGRGVEFYGLIKSEAAKESAEARYPLYMPYELPSDDNPPAGSSDYPDRRHHYTWRWETRQLEFRWARLSTRLNPPQGRQTETQRAPGPQQAPGKITRRPARLVGLRGNGGGLGVGGSGGSMFAISIPPSIWEGMKRNPDYMRNWINARTVPGSPPYRPRTSNRYRPPVSAERTYTESYIPDQDPNAIHQLVGFLEYSLALYHLDQLVESCRPDELAAVDQLVKERAELTVETNLSRTLEKGNSSLSEQPLAAGDDFRRRGLAWITGLARAEVAAMFVGFASRDDAFLRLASARDADAYREFVMDGMRTHYWSLTEDPDLQQVLKGEADVPTTLACMRRLIVAEGFLKSAATAFQDQWTPAQRAELNVWQGNLTALQKVLTVRIADYHQTNVEDRLE